MKNSYDLPHKEIRQPGHLILVNGGSSAGKSSACRAFQDIADEEYILLGIDHFWLAIPPKHCDLVTVEPKYFLSKTYHKDAKPYFHITPGPCLDNIIYASYKAIASYLAAGVNVISDQIFWKPEWFQAAIDTFSPYKVFYVGLKVSDEEGAKRERKRSAGANNTEDGSRPDGWNRCSAEITHANMTYDLELDNTHLSILETAQQIQAGYRACPNPSAFKQFYKGH